MTEMTRFIAQIMGPVYIVLAIGLFVQPTRFKSMMEHLKTDSLSTFSIGIATLVVGIVIVLKHSIWTSFPAGFISFFGWVAIVKGAWLIIDPSSGLKIGMKFKGNWQPLALVALILGLYLSWIGYQM